MDSVAARSVAVLQRDGGGRTEPCPTAMHLDDAAEVASSLPFFEDTDDDPNPVMEPIEPKGLLSPIELFVVPCTEDDLGACGAEPHVATLS